MLEYLQLIVGLGLLYKGADFLVDGSTSLAKKYGVSSLVIGLTIVAFGTSMPELIVNVIAAVKGNAEISYGNIVGSNIINILVILGISALVLPIAVHQSTIWKEIPFAVLASAILFIMSNKVNFSNSKNVLTRGDGIVLVCFFAIFIYYVFEMMKAKKLKVDVKAKKVTGLKIALMIIGGLAALFFGGKLTVDGAVAIARGFGVSEFLVSATIVALGTSLPELVTSVVAVIKKQMDLSVGNIVGSNIFNIFLIMGVTSIIRPLAVPQGINLDLFFAIISSILIFVFMFYGTRHKIDRWQGAVLLVVYIAYLIIIIKRG